MAERALITGITGQDGSYLTEFLLAKGYEVHGLMRRASLFNTDRIDHLYHDPHLAGPRLTLHYGDLTDGTGLRRVLETVNPDEVYNLGAQSHVKVSFDIPEYTAEVVAVGTLRLVEAVRDHVLHGGRPVRYYQAGSSVIATGKAHRVRDLVELAFAAAGLDWRRHVEVDPRYFRPTEVDALCGDPTQGARRSRLETAGQLPRDRQDDGRARYRTRPPRADREPGWLCRHRPRRRGGG